MKLLSRLIIAFAVCLIAFPALILTTPVQALSPAIDLSTSSGYVGDEIIVYGENFEPYSDISVYYYITSDDTDYVGGDTVTSDGSFSVDFNIPESYGGSHEIRVDYDSGDLYATFTVEPMLEITSPSEAEGFVGSQVTIKGTGFGEVEDYIEVRYYTTSSDFTVVR
ncbi:MAG: hypothetical protein COT13_06560, partial [Chloroflexi bacterium CG08_land_8_20_14_0_20_45_12]